MRNWISIVESYDDNHQKALERTGFWGSQGAGCLVLAQDTNRILIALRSMEVQEGGTYGTWGGAIDNRERPIDAVVRELEEETQYHGPVTAIKPLSVFRSGTFSYHNFLVVVPQEFTPELNWENDGYIWCDYGDWPSPLHFGL